jgi:hypothetical protein
LSVEVGIPLVQLAARPQTPLTALFQLSEPMAVRGLVAACAPVAGTARAPNKTAPIRSERLRVMARPFEVRR